MTSPASSVRISNFFNMVDAQPQPARTGLGSYPLGVNGNLQYTPEAGGTARATRAEIAWSGIYRTLADKWTDFKSCFISAHWQVRRQRAILAEASPFDGCIGNLLGSLTVKIDSRMRQLAHPHDQTRIVRSLVQLSLLSGSRLDPLGAKKICLRAHLKKLSDADLIALYSGVLNSQHCRASVLRQVPEFLFYQASEELDRIALAVNQRFTQKVVQKPFVRLAGLLSADPMDGKALRETLVGLARGLGQFEFSRTGRSMWSRDASLDIYLRLLPPELKRQLASLVQKETPLEKEQDPARKCGYACRMLDSIRMGLQRPQSAPPVSVSPGFLDVGLSGSSGHPDIQQEPLPALKRKDLAACAFGVVGNLRFTAVEGVTARASRIRVFLSETGHSLADRWAYLTSCFTNNPPEARARRAELAAVRMNSHRIGNFLGSLTAVVDRSAPIINAKDHIRVAQALKDLSVPPSGGLHSLKGATYCLDTYLSELKEFDLMALRHGILSDEAACRDVLDKISIHQDDPLRMRASRVLNDVAEAVNQRLARHAVHRPMQRVADLLAAPRVDYRKLRAQLMMIPNDTNMLERYFQALSRNELMVLRHSLRSEAVSEAKHVLAQGVGGAQHQALAMLDSVQVLLMDEIHKRAAHQK